MEYTRMPIVSAETIEGILQNERTAMSSGKFIESMIRIHEEFNEKQAFLFRVLDRVRRGYESTSIEMSQGFFNGVTTSFKILNEQAIRDNRSFPCVDITDWIRVCHYTVNRLQSDEAINSELRTMTGEDAHFGGYIDQYSAQMSADLEIKAGFVIGASNVRLAFVYAFDRLESLRN